MSIDYTTIVVGAGISGLSAAKCLQDTDVETLVIEARDRVGGRTLTKKDPKFNYVDLGGSYLGVTQDRLARITKELGIENYIINESEDLLHYKNGRRKRFSSNEFPSRRNPFANMDINNIFWLMDKMGKEIPADAPWNAPHAEEWDTMTVKDFLQKNCWTNEAIDFLSDFIRVFLTSEAYEASLLSFLWYTKQCNGVKRMYSTRNGGQERKFIGGSQQISEKLAAEINEPVILNEPVISISQENSKVTIKTLRGKEYRADYVILAIPPALQMKIHYNPPLPPLRNQLLQRMPMGSVIKCMIYYSTAFWKSKGLCGSLLIEGDDNHPGFYFLDDTKPDGSHPALVTFIAGDKARRLINASQDERLRKLCASIAEAMECSEALNPIHYEEKLWMEEQYSGGCYTAMYPPGLFTRYGRVLREPVGRIYFAGTETATSWSGYMEGAIQAGERAAREILHDMGKILEEEIWKPEPPSQDVKALPFDTSFTERFLPSVSGFLKFITVSSVLGAAFGAIICYKKCVHR